MPSPSSNLDRFIALDKQPAALKLSSRSAIVLHRSVGKHSSLGGPRALTELICMAKI